MVGSRGTLVRTGPVTRSTITPEPWKILVQQETDKGEGCLSPGATSWEWNVNGEGGACDVTVPTPTK